MGSSIISSVSTFGITGAADLLLTNSGSGVMTEVPPHAWIAAALENSLKVWEKFY